MQATIHIRVTQLRWVPHVRDGLIVANVGGVTNAGAVTNAVGVANVVAITNVNEAAIPPSEAR
jgi:hypothetical protein